MTEALMKLAKALADDLRPVRRRIEKALAQADEADAKQELRELLADLPQLFRRVNADPDTARAIEQAIIDGLKETNMNDNNAQVIINTQRSSYLNPDGTFVGGFDGCVRHFMETEGLPAENARALCAYIGRRAGTIPNTTAGAAAPLLNREIPADGWFHIVPRGEFHHESGLVQVLDDVALDAMVANFMREGKDVLVDQDHFSYQPDKPSKAFGWIKDIAKRSNGLWAKIDLTPPGAEAIKNGLYRFVSPVWAKADCESLGGNRVRPTRLDSVGLTNSPNLKGMVPLSNRATAATPSAETKPKTEGGTRMKDKLIPVLGLAADAADSAVVEAVTSLKNRVASLETANADLKKSNRELLESQVEADLDKYADRIANRDAMKKMLLNDRKTTLEMLASLKPVEKPVLHNRADKAGKVQNRDGSEKPETQADRIEREVRAKMLANRCSYRDAFDLVAAEKPELFAEEKEN